MHARSSFSSSLQSVFVSVCVLCLHYRYCSHKNKPTKKKEKKKGVLCLHNCYNCLCVVSALLLLLPQKQTHQKKKEFCASIIATTKWLWSSFTVAATARVVVILDVAALVDVNRQMTGWMKCPSGWMTVQVD